jgi:hypothetical protein
MPCVAVSGGAVVVKCGGVVARATTTANGPADAFGLPPFNAITP